MIRSMFNKSLIACCLVCIAFSCKQNTDQANYVEKEKKTDWESTRNYYLDHITDAISLLDTLETKDVKNESAKVAFAKARIAFKKAEPYASYLNPEVGHRVNGPALPIYKEDNGKVLHPIGFQKIEESIYDGGVTQEEFVNELRMARGLLTNLQTNIKKRELNPKRFFVATHQQLFRIISLAIAGFDTPVSGLGIKETITSLESLRDVYKLSIQYLIIDKNPELDTKFLEDISKATAFIEKNTDFETFDRYTFLREFMNPITRDWVNIRKESGIWEGSKNYPFNFDAPTFFEKESFNTRYFVSATNRDATEKQIALGEKLFFDPNISKEGKMSCATCHVPEKAYADGKVVNLDNKGKSLQRNTPTLINSIYQRSFFWDGRSPSLMDQISSVFNNKKEFDSSVHQFSEDILKDTSYVKLFEEAYGRVPTKNVETIKALSSYIATLNGFDSKFDKNIRGEIDTFTEEEKLGFNLYMGKALCATCHFMPLTNGTVPPFFKETEKEVIGVPETMANKKLDDDKGFYWRFEEELHRGMFKTPTVRNAALTSPYMHNGVYETLEQVMEFYNLGGGGGMGFDLPHQTLPFDQLNLTEKELNALVAYVKTLSDDQVTSEEYDDNQSLTSN